MQRFQEKKISFFRIPLFAALLGLLPVATPAHADLFLNTLGDATLIDFQGYTGAGLQPGGAAGTLDSDNWTMFLVGEATNAFTNFGDTMGTGLFGKGQSSGGVSKQGIYAFDTGGGNIALGTQPDESSNVTIAGVSLLITNNTGATVDHLRVSYDFWFFNDSDSLTENELEFIDGANFYDPNLLESPSGAMAVPAWQKIEEVVDLYLPVTDFGGTISEMANGDSMEILWLFSGFGGAGVLNGYDEVAIDNIRITPFSTTVPEPSTLLLSALASFGILANRSRKLPDCHFSPLGRSPSV